MSIYSLKLPFLQISPKVWSDKNYLYARTSKFYRILNMFLYSRTVIVDRIKKRITIKIKWFWIFLSKRYIEFNDIKYIDITKREVGNQYGFTPNGFGAQDVTESFYVQVIKKSSPYPEDLFRFTGDGGRYTGWFGVLLGDSIIDAEGRQYEKALQYAELVSKYTESKLWKDRNIEYSDNTEVQYKCLKCGHKITSNAIKCIYCGRVYQPNPFVELVELDFEPENCKETFNHD